MAFGGWWARLTAWWNGSANVQARAKAGDIAKVALAEAEAHPELVGAAVGAITKNPTVGKDVTEGLEVAAAAAKAAQGNQP